MEGIKKIWPKWEPVEVLGKGGFGTVHKCKRENFGEVLWSAIKVVKIPNDHSELKEMTSSGFSEQQIKAYYQKSVKALVDEIRLMDTMKSASHIVGIEDFEVVEDGIGWKVYIRMELLTNLQDYLTQKGVSVEEIVKMATHILTALEHCHELNIMHRDIKPANIFVSRFGEYKLGDFGISRQVERNNATMSQKGTKSYMAPEMIRLGKYGKNVDLYALGLTMYELLNHGRMPFLPPYPELFFPEDREEAMLKRLTGEEFPPIEGIGNLNEVILKACHYDPSLRYQSAVEMKKDLVDLNLNDEKEKRDVVIAEDKTAYIFTPEDSTTNVFASNDQTMNIFASNEKTSNIFSSEQQTDFDDKTMNVFNNNAFMFEDTTVVEKRDIQHTINRNNKTYYYIFNHGYIDKGNDIVLLDHSDQTIQLKKLYERYLKEDDKITVLEEMLKLDVNAKLYALLGDEYYKNKDGIKALEMYTKAIDLDDEDAFVLKRHAYIQYAYGKHEDALILLNKAIGNYSEGKCSAYMDIVHQLYFIKALCYQNLNNERDAIRAIADIEAFNFKNYIGGFCDANNISSLYKQFNEDEFFLKLLTDDTYLNTKLKIHVASMKLGIGANFFKEHLTKYTSEIKGTYTNNRNKAEKLQKQFGLDFDNPYIYVTTTLFGDAIFGQYGIYKYVEKKLYFMDYYCLPFVLLGTHDSSNLCIRAEVDYKESGWKTIVSGARKNPYIILTLCEMKHDLTVKPYLSEDLPLGSLYYMCNAKLLSMVFKINTVGDLRRLSLDDFDHDFIKDKNLRVYYKALKLQL